MNRVALGDVAIERRETCRGDKSRYPVVGLEHMMPENIALTAWDESGENTFTKMFHKGDMLFGRRRAYLKKAAVAPFDGICSGDITVIEAKPDHILPELLPFVIQNDAFFDFAVGKSAGSLSPRAKWEHLKDYEFNLPSIDGQRKLAKTLWAVNDTMEAYKKLLSATDELVKSQFIEMFGDPIRNDKGWPKTTIAEVTRDIVSGQSLNGEARRKLSGEKAVLKVSAVTYGYFKDDEYKVLNSKEKITKYVYPQMGDLLFSRANTKEYVGATALIDKDYPDLLLPDKLWKLVLIDSVDAVYMKTFLTTPEIRKAMSNMATGTSGSMYNISMEKLRSLSVILPPLHIQERFAVFVRQADKSKFELEQALAAAKATYKSIIAENLG